MDHKTKNKKKKNGKKIPILQVPRKQTRKVNNKSETFPSLVVQECVAFSCLIFLNFPKIKWIIKPKTGKKTKKKKNLVLRFLRKQTRKIKNNSETLISYFKNVLNFLASKTIQKILFDRNGYNLWNVIDRRRSQRSINEPLPRRWSRRFRLIEMATTFETSDKRRSRRSIDKPLPRRRSRRLCLSRFGGGSHGLNHVVWSSKCNYSRRARSLLGSNRTGVMKRLDFAIDKLQRRRCCFCVHCRIERPLEGESAIL